MMSLSVKQDPREIGLSETGITVRGISPQLLTEHCVYTSSTHRAGVYLAPRMPLPINYNYFLVFKDAPVDSLPPTSTAPVAGIALPQVMDGAIEEPEQ